MKLRNMMMVALGAAALVIVPAAAAMAAPAHGFVQFDGLRGETVSPSGHEGVFEISDYSFDVEQTLNIGSQSSGSGAGKITFNPFTITRSIDSASPKFVELCASGKHFPQVVLETRRASGAPVTLVLHDVAIRDYRKEGNAESFVLAPAYATIER